MGAQRFMEQLQEGGNMRYILHAWKFMEGDQHGDQLTYSHTYRDTDAGWVKLTAKQKEYVDKGYTTSVVRVK